MTEGLATAYNPRWAQVAQTPRHPSERGFRTPKTPSGGGSDRGSRRGGAWPRDIEDYDCEGGRGIVSGLDEEMKVKVAKAMT